jgi:hypothetical protein
MKNVIESFFYEQYTASNFYVYNEKNAIFAARKKNLTN